MLQQPKLERDLRGGHGDRTRVDEREKLAKVPTLANLSTPVGVSKFDIYMVIQYLFIFK